MNKIRVTIWNEYIHEKKEPEVAKIYPQGIHQVIGNSLKKYSELEVTTSTLDEPEHGLSEQRCCQTDVLIWWGHAAHDQVNDEIVSRVHKCVLQGMGLVVLHSGHYSKIFKKLMGTTCLLSWREAGERERIWVANPGHAIAEGIGPCIELEHSEMYGEPFSIPPPDEQVFISWFEGGEVFRGGCCWTRGNGKIFYFSPGHELYPIYHNPDIQRVIYNAVRWAKPQGKWIDDPRHMPEPREKILSSGPQLHDPTGALR